MEQMDVTSQHEREAALLAEPRIFDHMTALADGLRCRLLLLVAREELTVSDLCAVVQMPQSTVSRHLKLLHEGGWVDSRRDGTRRLYRATPERLDEAALRLWDLTREEIAATPAGRADRDRLRSVLARSKRRSQEFFDASADAWDAMRDELFGSGFLLHALVGLADPDWTVGDLGCGTGAVSEALAPCVRKVIAIDGSPAMLERARERLRRFDQVECVAAELESLPLDDASLDVATAVLVLHHLPAPGAFLAEAARTLRPGGRLLVVDMLPHDREAYRREMGHEWLGFDESTVRDLLAAAGFEAVRWRALPPAAEARGPNLFAAVARRTADPEPGSDS